jgi:tetratricopeptide (TPR) repeat protein
LPKPIGGSRGFAQYEKRDASVRLIAATATRPIDPARAFYDSGTAAFNNGDYQKAVRDFSQAIKLSPDWPEAHYSLAVALTEVEKPKEAIEQFEQVLKLDPTDQLKILSSYNIGNAQSELGENEAAVEAYKRAIQIDPKLSKPHNNLGLAYAALSRISEALAEFKRAVELRDDYAEAHFNLGIAYLQSGRKEEAQVQQQLLLKLKPELAARLEALLKE